MEDVIRAVNNKDMEALKAMFAPLCTSDDTKYECDICQDTGWVDIGERRVKPCRCMAVKKARRQMRESGLEGLLDRYTFETFIPDEPWQKGLFDLSREYLAHVQSGGKAWLYLAGQPGCGKTHLCTAVCGELLQQGIPVRYMLWTDQTQRIKADINNSEAMDRLLEPLKTVPVLYVDDLFKGPPGPNPTPSAADLRLAFEIFNMRYVRQLCTIVSGEWDLTTLIGLDQGTFSRVYQQSKGFTAFVGPDMRKNFRLRGV